MRAPAPNARPRVASSLTPRAFRAPPSCARSLRVVAALVEGRSYEHLRSLFDGTPEATAVLTLCARIDATRAEHPGESVRLNLRLAKQTDCATDLDLSITFGPLGKDRGPRTPPPRGTGEGSNSGSGASSSGGSSGAGAGATPYIISGPATV